MAEEKNDGVLKNIKVIDFTIALAGAFTAWLFADLGARVWKVERLGSGDQARYWDPCVPEFGGQSTLFMSYNKNKESIEINLKEEAGKQIIFDMVKDADVVLENFKGGSMDRLGLGYDKLKEINPKLVFLSLSGFGGSGPLMKYPCYDAIAEARSGFAASNGEPGGAPVKACNTHGDSMTGAHAFVAVLMALIEAKNTGKGCHIDIGMTDVCMQGCSETIMDYGLGKEVQDRFGNHDRFTAPYGIFEARDGWVVIIADSEKRWKALCETLGLKEFENDPRFCGNALRVEHKEELIRIIEEVTRKMRRAEIEKKLLAAGVPASEVLPFIEAYTSDHANAVNVSRLAYQEKVGMMRFYNNPILFDGRRCPIRKGAPLLGQHTEKILKEMGYGKAKIEKLYESGVVASSMT